MQIYLHQNDLPSDLSFFSDNFKGEIAVDTESMGLKTERDRLCLVQVSQGDGVCHLVQIPDLKKTLIEAPNLKKLLENPKIPKILHYARADLTPLKKYLDITVAPVFCTKIASKLARTYTDRHSLKELCKVLLNIDILKEESCSDWGAPTLTDSQLSYAATDVLYLHQIKDALLALLKRENRLTLAQGCFNALSALSALDACGFSCDEIIRY